MAAMVANLGCYMAEIGLASPEDIDTAMELGLNYPRGSIALGEEMGAQTCYQALSVDPGDHRRGPLSPDISGCAAARCSASASTRRTDGGAEMADPVTKQTTARWKNRPEGSNWGDFGPDDQIGRLNWLGPEQVLKGMAEVREGRSLLPLDAARLSGRQRAEPGAPSAAAVSPRARPTAPTASCCAWRDAMGNPDLTDVVNDDRVMIHTQYSTQWDAFAHVGSWFDADGDGQPEAVFYNGWRGGEHIATAGDMPRSWRADGQRGQTPRHRDDRRDLRAGQGGDDRPARRPWRQRISTSTWRAWKRPCATQKVDGREGRHGAVPHRLDEADAGRRTAQPTKEMLHGSCTALEGRDPRLQEWVRDSGLVALIADNYAVERAPSRTGQGQARRPAAARALPLQARHSPGRDLVAGRPRRTGSATTAATGAC